MAGISGVPHVIPHKIHINGSTAGDIQLRIRAASGQTANVTEVQNSAGTTLFSVDNSGNVSIAGNLSAVINEVVTGDLTLTGNLQVNGNTTLGNAAGDTVTVTGTATFTPSATFTGGLTSNNLITLGGATALTAASYQIGRNADSNLQYNVPLVRQHIFSTGDVATMTVASTGVGVNTAMNVGGMLTTQSLTVTGSATFLSAATFSGGLHLPDDDYIHFGNTAVTPDAGIGWNTAQTVDAWYHGTADGQNVYIIAEYGDRAFDFAHGAATNPTLFVHSAVQNTTQWVSLVHDQTDAIITTGTGAIRLESAGGLVAQGNGGLAQVYRTRSASTGTGGIEIAFGNIVGGFFFHRNSWAQTGIAVSDDGGNQLIITNYTNRGIDHDRNLTTDPTLFIFSDISADVSNNQWGSLAHNQTDLVFTTGDATGAGTGATTNNNGFSFQPRGAEVLNIQGLYTTGTPTQFLFTGAAHTGLTAATEDIDINFNLARNKTWADGAGPLATQRDFLIQAATYVGGAGGALTITTASTFVITSSPAVGANMAITNSNVATLGGAVTIGATAASMTYDVLDVPAHTVTVTGSTQVTSANAFAGIRIGQITISDASAVTIDQAASLYIANAPVGGGVGPATVTNAYSIFVDAGNTRFDGYNAMGVGANPTNGVVLFAGANGTTMPASTTAWRDIQTGGNVTELAGAAITDIVGAYFNTFTVTDGGGAETVGILATVYINNAPTAGTAPSNGPYSLFVDAGTTRLDGLLQQNDAIYFTQTDGNEKIDSAADGYLDYTVTTAHRFNMSAADTDVRLEFVGTTSSGLLEWMEDEDYFRFGDVIATAVNIDVNLSAGSRIYGGGVQFNKQDLAAGTNLTLDENDSVVNVTSGGGSANTITLPAASGNEGMIISVYLVTDGGQNANVVRAGADVIQNGSADLANTQVALDDAGDFVMLQCVNSTMWQILINSGGTVT